MMVLLGGNLPLLIAKINVILPKYSPCKKKKKKSIRKPILIHALNYNYSARCALLVQTSCWAAAQPCIAPGNSDGCRRSAARVCCACGQTLLAGRWQWAVRGGGAQCRPAPWAPSAGLWGRCGVMAARGAWFSVPAIVTTRNYGN